MCGDSHFPRLIDTEITPKQQGRLDYGRGGVLADCPYTDSKDIIDYQEGWRKARDRYPNRRPLI